LKNSKKHKYPDKQRTDITRTDDPVREEIGGDIGKSIYNRNDQNKIQIITIGKEFTHF
jgi:hypothetical protein